MVCSLLMRARISSRSTRTFLGGVHAYPHLVALDGHDRHGNIVADDQRFAGTSGKDQHVAVSLNWFMSMTPSAMPQSSGVWDMKNSRW